jgi:cell division protein FtsB
MKVKQKKDEKKVEKKSNFSFKALFLMLFTAFIIGSMGTSLISNISGAVRSIKSNNEIQDKYKQAQAEVAEQNNKIDGLKSKEGTEAIVRADGMVKDGEVPVQIQFAPGSNPAKEDVNEKPSLFNPLSGLIGVLIAASALTTIYLFKKKKISISVSAPVAEQPEGLVARTKE